MPSSKSAPPRIVIVGGGAGGLELATRLGDSLGRRGRAEVTLVERSRSHLWKPLLHQAAAGTLGVDDQALSYLAQSSRHHFAYRLGAMDGLDRARRLVRIAPTLDADGREMVPRRSVGYDILVIAVGSRSHDFGTPGVAEHAIALDTPAQARLFQRRLLDACIAAQTHPTVQRQGQLEVVIIGGGATGVELAAELWRARRALAAYGLDDLGPGRHVRVSLLEAAARLLPPLSPRLSRAAAAALQRLGVQVHTGTRVTEVRADGVATADGGFHAAELVVWAAGIQAPPVLRALDGLETNGINQLLVGDTLQTTRDPCIYAFGDCAACRWPGHDVAVPPRAQAAHQQAALLAAQIPRHLAGSEPLRFRYRDFGSLVSLGGAGAVGTLMGGLSRGSLFVERRIARLAYWSLARRHLWALHGFWRTLLLTLAHALRRGTEPRVKLH